jgi:triphosphoribosyl-dephospho-CoA synthetase
MRPDLPPAAAPLRAGPAAQDAPDRAAARIGRLAVRSLLREVAAAPKPGLVDRFGTGSHDDMDFMTFADSALVLGPAFVACARAGWAAGAADPSLDPRDGGPLAGGAFLASLRPIGLEAERAMFAATGGVNTHKGALFLLGLLSAAAGALLGSRAAAPILRPAPRGPAAAPALFLGDAARLLAARIAGGSAAAELPAAATAGAAAYRAHGLAGIRGEVESALPSLGPLPSAAPAADSALEPGALALLRAAPRPFGDAPCVEALLLIMLAADDTTLVHRGGLPALAFAREGARSVLAAGALRAATGRAALASFSEAMVARRLSPGGSADLLAAALFLADLERAFAPPPAAPNRRKTSSGSMKSARRAILSLSV